jgi:hypothetical protein
MPALAEQLYNNSRYKIINQLAQLILKVADNFCRWLEKSRSALLATTTKLRYVVNTYTP